MSVQLSQYLAARASAATIEHAADVAGFSIEEARLTETAIAKGEIELPRARAPARTREDQSTKEDGVLKEETTISVNGGPEVPLSVAKEALDIVQGRRTENVAADHLRRFIERIERLAEERKGIADDIAEVYGEAKANGYDKPTMRRIVRLRAMEPHHRQEAAALLETYANALGLQDVLPL